MEVRAMGTAVIVRHRVKDYDTWRPLFEEHGEVRRRYGAQGHELYRTDGDANELIIVNRFRDLAGAHAFAADPSLPEVMQRAGVISEPQISFCELVETADYGAAVG